MRRLGAIAVVSLLSVAMAGRAAAQVAGIPYYVNPRGGTGLMAAANLGGTSSDNAAVEGKAWALTGGLGAGPLFLTATVGTFNPDPTGAENVTTFGGTVGMKLFGGPLVPLTIGVQAGAGYYATGSGTSETKLVSIPVAVGVGLNIPLFPLKPWIAPRVQFDRSTTPGASGATTTNLTRLGISAGADFNLLLGLGFHAAVDYLPEKTSGSTTYAASTTIGIGAHFHFRVPMM
jgi:hypothetical protein